MTTLIGLLIRWNAVSRSRSTSRSRGPSLFSWFKETLELQRDRWVLWLPVVMAFGAAGWLAAPQAPPVWWPAGAAIGGLVAALGASSLPWQGPAGALRIGAAGLFSVVAALGCGGLAAQARIAAVQDAPRLVAPVGPVMIVGMVQAVEAGRKRDRMILLPTAIETMSRLPRRIRITTPSAFGPGRWVRCVAELSPPAPPATPWGFDPQRRAFFQRIGAVGFTYGPCRPLAPPGEVSSWIAVAMRFGAWRRDLAEIIAAANPGVGGALAAALITGDRSLLDEETEERFFAAGLGHLLSVSGLHMTLVAGTAFFALWTLLALIPPLALRAPIKKIAAGAALAGAAAYLAVSGASVPAQRAFVMTAVALGAVLLDRPALTLRGLALAAVVVIVLTPESVLDAGFQMSFAATLALVATFEVWNGRPRGATARGLIGALHRVEAAAAAALLTSFIAGLAADPIAAFHFQRFSLYGVPANLAASPLITFVIAPAAVGAAALAPFGAAQPALDVMAWGLTQIDAVAALFADRPEAVQGTPPFAAEAFLALLAAGLCAALWRGPLRYTALAPLGLALTIMAMSPQLAALVSADGRVVLLRTDEPGHQGWRVLRPARGGDFLVEAMGLAAGLPADRVQELARPTQCSEMTAACTATLHGGGALRAPPAPGRSATHAQPAAPVIVLVADPANGSEPTRWRPVEIDPRRGGLAVWRTGNGRLIARAARPMAFSRAWGEHERPRAD